MQHNETEKEMNEQINKRQLVIICIVDNMCTCKKIRTQHNKIKLIWYISEFPLVLDCTHTHTQKTESVQDL